MTSSSRWRLLLTFVAVGVGLVHLATTAAQDAIDPESLVYPEGKRFPLALYSIHTSEEMAEAGEAGWIVGHKYNFKPEYLDIANAAGWLAVAHLRGKTTVADPPNKGEAEATGGTAQAANTEEAGGTANPVKPQERPMTEEETAAEIAVLAAYENLAWWDLPEEQRYWRPDEYDLVKNLSAWTRKYDPRQRPNYMYLPGHYTAAAVAKYVEYLDIIGAGTYTEYSHQPRAWVRWRQEETLKGIELAGYEVGPDYRNGQKTPIGIPMLFCDPLKMGVMVPAEAYHDFWSCIASGAKGIFVFSYWHQRDVPTLKKTWALGYKRAAANLMAAGDLNQAILFGEDIKLDVEITKGAAHTPTFRPYGVEEDISFPSVNVLARAYQGTLYIVAVSSQERPVSAEISGLPEGIGELEVLCEDRPEDKGGDKVAVTAGTFEDTFPWLTVHLYSAPMPK
jgi:hypothetical protein